MVALLRVRNHVLVRELDALRRAFGTGTEEDDCIVGKFRGGEPQPAEDGLGRRYDGECRENAAERRNLRLFLVEVDHLALARDLPECGIAPAELVVEGVRGDDGRDVRLLDAAEDGVDGGGVVEVHARLSGAEDGHDAECRVAAGRQHEAHVLVALRDGAYLVAEVAAEADHAVAAHVVSGGVDEDDAAAALAHGLEPERHDGFGVVHRHVPDVGGEELQVAADLLFARVGGERLSEPDADDAVEGLRTVHALGGLAVAAAPEPLDVERNDLRARSLDGLGVVEREGRDERRLRDFALGEDDDGLAVQERLADFFHGGARVAAVDVDDELAVRKPAQVPVGERVPVACHAQRPGRRHLEHGPVDEAEVRPYQEKRARFGEVVYAHHLDAVAEYESECESQCRAQQGHRGLLEVPDKADGKDHRENHEAVVERGGRKDQEQRLAAHDEHEERHLDAVRDGVDAARRIGSREALDDRAQDDERRTRAETDDAVEESLEPVVMHEGEREHRDGRGRRRERDESRLHESLGCPARRERADNVAQRDDEHRDGDDGRVEHVGHVLDEHQEYLSDAPECREPEDGEADNGMAPCGGEIAHGGAEPERVVVLAHADAESGDGCDDAEAEVNPQRKVDADGGIGPPGKSHREERGTRRAEDGVHHVPGVNLDEVFAFDHLLHDSELGRGEHGEEYAVEAQQAVGDPFGARHVAHDDRDDGGEHPDGAPCHHATLAEVPREVAGRGHHEDAGGEDGDLEQHAAPPERGTLEREGEPALEMDEQAHLHKDAAKDEQQEREDAGVLAQFHKTS